MDNLMSMLDDLTSLGADRNLVLATIHNKDLVIKGTKIYTKAQSTAKYGINSRTIKGETLLKVDGELILTTPKGQSKTIAEASEWYREQISNIPNMIKQIKQIKQINQNKNVTLSMEDEIEYAQILNRAIQEGAMASLFPQGYSSVFEKLPVVKRLFKEQFPLPDINKIRIDNIGKSDDELNKIIFDALTKAPETKATFELTTCFAAGTLVHTKEGLVPIENIKVGDWVLSKPENGGEQAYKRVLRTFSHKPTRVINVYYNYYEGEVKKAGRVTTTLDHPFWVVDKGWVKVKDLGDESPWWCTPFGIKNDLELYNGHHVTVQDVQPIYISERPGVGWHCIYPGETYSRGYLYDYVNHQLATEEEVFALENIRYHLNGTRYKYMEKHHPAHYLKLPVYNLEVEDFHTYYVGQHGVWVHNKDYNGGITFKADGKLLSEN